MRCERIAAVLLLTGTQVPFMRPVGFRPAIRVFSPHVPRPLERLLSRVANGSGALGFLNRLYLLSDFRLH